LPAPRGHLQGNDHTSGRRCAVPRRAGPACVWRAGATARRSGLSPASRMQGISFVVSPIRDHAFFEQTVLQGEIGHTFLQITGLTAQVLHLVRGRSTRSVTSQTALAGLHELLGPGVIQALCDPFTAAQLGNGVIAAQAIEHDPDLVFSREVPTGLAADVLYDLPGRLFGP